jgi:hypothetical protein
MLRNLGKLATGAKQLANDAHHSVVGDVGRSFVHKLNNAVGSDRDLYGKPKKFTLTDNDVRRYIQLKQQTTQELERAKIGYQALADAIQNRCNTDSLYLQARSAVDASHAVLESQQLTHDLKAAQNQSFIAGQRRELVAMLAADEHAEMMAATQAWQTVNVSAQQAQDTRQAQQGGFGHDA